MTEFKSTDGRVVVPKWKTLFQKLQLCILCEDFSRVIFSLQMVKENLALALDDARNCDATALCAMQENSVTSKNKFICSSAL